MNSENRLTSDFSFSNAYLIYGYNSVFSRLVVFRVCVQRTTLVDTAQRRNRYAALQSVQMGHYVKKQWKGQSVLAKEVSEESFVKGL